MPLPKRKAIGQRGSWFAEVNEEPLPCVHDYWTRKRPDGLYYNDPNCDADASKWKEFIGALKEKGKVILTQDKAINDGLGFERQGYIAVFSIEDVAVDGRNLTFRFVERLINLT